MFEVHLTCPWDAVLSLLHAFTQQFEHDEQVSVLDWGYTYKAVHGYIVLEWDAEEVTQAFIDQLDAESLVLDFCVYAISEVAVLLAEFSIHGLLSVPVHTLIDK